MANGPDALWPAAASLLTTAPVPGRDHIGLVGAHTFSSSVTPRSAQPTAPAIRAALGRYSTWSYEDQVDLLEALRLLDYGDVAAPDTDDGDSQLRSLLQSPHDFWILLGGDNALTWRGLRALAGENIAQWGLITLDAHLDLRDGESNGSPVRQLLAEGLDGHRVVQIGLADFSNSAPYARRANEAGLTAVSRAELRTTSIEAVVARALAIAGADGRPVYVDIDMDVCDRSVVPGCPAAAPGGVSADELRHVVRALSADPRVRALDITEIDVGRDSADERTVRLAALVLLEALAGYARRSS